MNEHTEYGITYAYMEYNSAFKRGGILLHVPSWIDGFEDIMLCVKLLSKRQMLETFIYVK